jgi:hypothetical protein
MEQTMRKPHAVLLAVLLVLAGLVPAGPVFGEASSDHPSAAGAGVEAEASVIILEAEEPDNRIENRFLFQDDLVIQGVTNRQDYYFEIPKSRKVAADSYIELRFGHSPALIQDRSTITVLLDDRPLGSQFLTAANQKDAKWRLDLDGMELSAGFHKFSLIVHMEATDNLCMDQNNPANWFVLHKESVIHLRYGEGTVESDLSWYPIPFLEKGSLTPYNTIFVVPDEPAEQDLLGLAKLARHFTGIVPNLEHRVFLESELTADALKSGHLIWIGSAGSWKGPGAELEREAGRASGGADLAEGAAWVRPSRWNDEYRTLLITGRDDGLARAVAMMTDPTLYGQLSGSFASAAGVQAAASSAPAGESGAAHTVTLESLQYGDLVVEGLMVGSALISYNVPAEYDISRGGKLHIMFRHSKSLNFAQSQAVIRINGIPAASTYLSKETSDFGVLEAEIPEVALRGSYINAEIMFQFGSAGEACSGGAFIGNWAVIDNASYFSFSSLPNRDLKLANLPYPFVAEAAWNPVTILLPEKPTSAELTLYAIVNGQYGGDPASYGNVRLVAMPDDVTGDEPWLSDHLIVICAADRLPSWLAGIGGMPVVHTEAVWEPAVEAVRMADNIRNDSGIIQLFPSTFREGKDILMLSASTDERLEAIGATLLKPQTRDRMDGQVIVIDRLDRMHVFDTGQYEPVRSIWWDVTEYLRTDNLPVLQRLLYIGAIAVALVLFAAIVWLISNRRRRNSN